MAYQIQIEKSALKRLSKIEKPTREKIRAAINNLAENPRPHGYKKLVDEGGLYRIKAGDYRISTKFKIKFCSSAFCVLPSATNGLIKYV
jgi:mRNA interferase RelE/StbE